VELRQLFFVFVSPQGQGQVFIFDTHFSGGFSAAVRTGICQQFSSFLPPNSLLQISSSLIGSATRRWILVPLLLPQKVRGSGAVFLLLVRAGPSLADVCFSFLSLL
jgi:hypothetical protein